MGSGYGNAYSGTRGGSQPYAASYKVVPQMLNIDKKDSDIYSKDNGYFKNPTAIKLKDTITGSNVNFEGGRANGDYTYVMDKSGNIIFGKRCNPNDGRKRSPHPTLLGGKNPEVQCAGMINFRNGKIYSVNTDSGHYRPNSKSLDKVDNALQKLYDSNPNLFHRQSKWRKNNG
ncbi:MAG: hypothetical protein K6B14_08495 [Lachnospiraceae bacterium]|nr:hypothetical protein [Lachnospiraceae bacterium]